MVFGYTYCSICPGHSRPVYRGGVQGGAHALPFQYDIHNIIMLDTLVPTSHVYILYVTVLKKNGLIAGLAKIDFFPEMASTKLRYCLSKI